MLNEIVKKATGGIDSLVDDLIKAASDKIKEKVAEAFSIQKLERLKENIGRVGRVKTILDPDTIVDLKDIYFEGAITFHNKDIVKNISFFQA